VNASARRQTPPRSNRVANVAPRQGEKKPRSSRRLTHAERERRRRNSLLLKVSGAIIAGIVVLAVIYAVNTSGASSAKPNQAGQYRFDVASPAVGALAPEFALPSTAGGTVRLADFRGKNVLLYFQEGIGCEGCWTQMKDVQHEMGRFNEVGIDTMITITTNPLSALRQKVADESLTLPVLSDESFAVSHAYNATQFGMMAGSADGHTFILVGPDGRIRWRADYGGPPNYTMYVPIGNLIADIQAGTKADANAK
jgi:peroxiredoxin